MAKLREYFEEKLGRTSRFGSGTWGFPFIAGFMVLLVAAAIFLAGGWAGMAETTADALFIGVVLQLACFGKNRLKHGVVP